MARRIQTELSVPRPEPLDLAVMPTDDLRAELARGLTLTAEVLTRLGSIWAELERRGEDLSDLRSGLARTLPLIAAGLLSAEAVVAFAGRPMVLRALEGLPLDHQRRLAAGEPVAAIDPTEPARVIEMPLTTMPAAAVRLALGDGSVRTPDAQRLLLRPRRSRRDDAGGSYRYRPRYDQATGTVQVGRMSVAVADLMAALSAAAGPDHPPSDVQGEYATLKVRLHHDECQRLLDAARRAGLPEWEMIRKSLRAFGLI